MTHEGILALQGGKDVEAVSMLSLGVGLLTVLAPSIYRDAMALTAAPR